MDVNNINDKLSDISLNADNNAEISDNELTNNSNTYNKEYIDNLIKQLDEAKNLNAMLQKTIRDDKLQTAIDDSLRLCGSKNIKAVKSLLNLSKISLDDKDNIIGLSEQIDRLKLSDDSSFMFKTNTCADIIGADVLESSYEDDFQISKAELENINLTKQSDLCNNNPSLAKKIVKTLFGN